MRSVTDAPGQVCIVEWVSYNWVDTAKHDTPTMYYHAIDPAAYAACIGAYKVLQKERNA